jgi:hypothetical protein
MGILLHLLTRNPESHRALSERARVSDNKVWHVWAVTIPRRSITGRLVWGTVFRRRVNGRWTYKEYKDRN